MFVNGSGRNQQSFYRTFSIDASYQISDQLALRFQRRRLKCEKVTDDERQVMANAHIAFGKVSLKMNTTWKVDILIKVL